MRRLSSLLIATAAFAIGAPLEAATISGTLYPSPFDSPSVDVPFDLSGPGLYSLSFTASRPVYLDFNYLVRYMFTDYDVNGQEVNGNGATFYLSEYSQGKSGTVRFRVEPTSYDYGPDYAGYVRVRTYEFQGGSAAFTPQDFGSAPLGYTITTSVIPNVPEPSTWAMLIAGVGSVGAALRRRRKHGKPGLSGAPDIRGFARTATA